MNLQQERITQLCTDLRLERIATDYPALAQKAVEDEASFAEFLERLLAHEAGFRQERCRQTLTRMACFPALKTLEAFDFAFAHGVPKTQILELAALAFVERTENVVLLGPSGVGKTHLAIALGYLLASLLAGGVIFPLLAKHERDRQTLADNQARLQAIYNSEP